MTPEPPLRLPVRASNAHKGSFGRVMLVGGSRGMSGSIALSSIAALHTGSGLVSAAIPDRCLETVASFHPGVMTIAIPDDSQGRFSLEASTKVAAVVASIDAVGCGPGMTTHDGAMRIVDRLLQIDVPRVLDADAINCLADMNRDSDILGQVVAADKLVLTPHPGEFQRLSGVNAKDREAQLAAAIELSTRTGVVIVLKGGPSIVVGSGTTWTNKTGNPGMATAGSGDVLTGIITSLAGQGLSAWDAARLGVWIHGMAGDLAENQSGQAGMTCLEIAGALPAAAEFCVGNGC